MTKQTEKATPNWFDLAKSIIVNNFDLSNRPWHLHDMEENTICGSNNLAIANCNSKRPGKVNKANAELIVRAVNSFDSLVEACKESLHLVKLLVGSERFEEIKSDRAILKLAQAIAQAEKEGEQ